MNNNRYPYQFKTLLSVCPIVDLRERILNLKTVPQRPDFHPEGSVYNHTQIVVDRLASFRDQTLSWAAMFHDIGKDVTTKENEKGILQAIGHEEVSGDLVRAYGPLMPGLADWGLAEEVVRFHMRIKLFEQMTLKKQMEMRRLRAFGYLLLFREADSMKTLTPEELNSIK